MRRIKLSISLILLALLLLAKWTTTLAQGHRIKMEITGLPDTVYQVGYYWGANQYPLREVAMTHGKIEILGDEALATGVYYLSKPGFRFDFLIKEQQFGLSFNGSDPYGSLNVVGSEENEVFAAFQKLREKSQTESAQLLADMQKATGADSIRLVRQFILSQNETALTLDRIAEKNQALYAAALIRLIKTPDTPDFGHLTDQAERMAAMYQYRKDHYWNGVDLAEVALLRTPWLYPKMMKYLDRLIIPHPDSIIIRIDQLLEVASKNTTTFKFWLGTFSNKYHFTQAFGMEQVYVHLCERYYLSEEIDWMPESSLDIIREDLTHIKPNLVGQKAPPLNVRDQKLQSVDPIQESSGQYRVLFFYDPNCEHCREAAPLLNQEYGKLAEMEVKLLSICTIEDQKQWNDFIRTYDLVGTHMIKAEGAKTFHHNYDIRSTPKVFVLNKAGIIVGRNLDVNQVVHYVNYAQELGF